MDIDYEAMLDNLDHEPASTDVDKQIVGLAAVYTLFLHADEADDDRHHILTHLSLSTQHGLASMLAVNSAWRDDIVNVMRKVDGQIADPDQRAKWLADLAEMEGYVEDRPHPVLVEVAEERARQDAQWGGPDHDDNHNLADWSNFIDSQLCKLGDTLSPTATVNDSRECLVKIAALAVAAVESYDRKCQRAEAAVNGNFSQEMAEVCSQCCQPFSASPCGPLHAIRAATDADLAECAAEERAMGQR